MSDGGPALEFFLGGGDLEMVTIRDLLNSQSHVVHDGQLSWGAKASAYRDEIAACRSRGHLPVLVELIDDLNLQAGIDAGDVLSVDHHGQRAGANVPTALEQIFALLKRPAAEWSRHFALVAANDRGYIEEMQELNPPASREEIQSIREADRRAQRISQEEEAVGRMAAEQAEWFAGDRLTVVRLPHNRGATVSDVLHATLGGPGYKNLLIFTPSQTLFQGEGRAIDRLKQLHPGGWSGGALPTRGYWGISHNLEGFALIQALEKVVTTQPASAIEVRAFHHTLLWPLIMRGGSGDDLVDEFIKAFQEAGWKEELSGQHNVAADYTYEEIVYFHPFVRDLLFGDGRQDNTKRTLRRMKRTDLKAVNVKIQTDPKRADTQFSKRLCVERAELLLIRPDIVLLLVELSNREERHPDSVNPKVHEDRVPLKLAEAMQLQSRLRHIYPPYFADGLHGDCVMELKWDGLDSGREFSTTTDRQLFDEFVHRGAEPPAYSHWMQLFNSPESPEQVRCLSSALDRKNGGLFLQQLLDDRMPGLSFLAVDNPDSITQEDQDGLIDFNSPGLVYQEAFRERERAQFRYDRFRHWGTTYYCNGTSFTLVCNTYRSDDGNCFSDLLLTHFRRHYTHLAVLAQYQHAALLYFADELAEIAPKMQMSGESLSEPQEQEWRTRLKKLQHRFLKFRTRSYFTEVSNQIQGKDLFQLWFDRLGTASLFDRVASTCTEVYEAVENEEIRDLTRSQNRLSELASRGLALSLGLASASIILSWISLFPDEVQSTPSIQGKPIWGPWIWGVLAAIPGGGAWCLFQRFDRNLRDQR